MIKLKSDDWEIGNIEAIIFDKDGTFIDLHYFWGKMTELRVFELIKRYRLNENLFENLCLFLGFDIKNKKMLPDGITALYSRSVIIEMLIKKLNEFGCFSKVSEIENIFDCVSDNFYKNITKYIKPIDEAIEFIKNVRNHNIKLAVVTADSVVSTNLALRYLNLEKYFDFIIGRESCIETKESGIPTMLAVEKLGVSTDKTIMIGDSPTDAISAKNAKLKATILAATGQIDMQTLKLTSPYCVNSLNDIEMENMFQKIN